MDGFNIIPFLNRTIDDTDDCTRVVCVGSCCEEGSVNLEDVRAGTEIVVGPIGPQTWDASVY